MSLEPLHPRDHIGRVINDYCDFWERLRGTQGIDADENNDEITARQDGEKIIVGTIPSERPSVELELGSTYLRFEGVRYDRTNPSDLMDICIQFAKGIQAYGDPENPSFVLKNSRTAVSYFRYDEGPGSYTDDGKRPVNLIQSIHYDHNQEPYGRHPIFHAQYNPRSIEFAVLEDRYEIRNKAEVRQGNPPKFPRIPSAPMDFPGVVYLLLKSHFNEHTNWPNNVLSTLEKLPCFHSSIFEPRPQNDTMMSPEWWYVHAPDGEELRDDVIDFRQPDI